MDNTAGAETIPEDTGACGAERATGAVTPGAEMTGFETTGFETAGVDISAEETEIVCTEGDVTCETTPGVTEDAGADVEDPCTSEVATAID